MANLLSPMLQAGDGIFSDKSLFYFLVFQNKSPLRHKRALLIIYGQNFKHHGYRPDRFAARDVGTSISSSKASYARDLYLKNAVLQAAGPNAPIFRYAFSQTIAPTDKNLPDKAPANKPIKGNIRSLLP